MSPHWNTRVSAGHTALNRYKSAENMKLSSQHTYFTLLKSIRCVFIAPDSVVCCSCVSITRWCETACGTQVSPVGEEFRNFFSGLLNCQGISAAQCNISNIFCFLLNLIFSQSLVMCICTFRSFSVKDCQESLYTRITLQTL